MLSETRCMQVFVAPCRGFWWLIVASDRSCEKHFTFMDTEIRSVRRISFFFHFRLLTIDISYFKIQATSIFERVRVCSSRSSSCFVNTMNSALTTEREGVIGASPPPFGVVPNFNHPKSQGNRIIVVIAILLPLATFVLFLRIYTKRMIVRTLGSDDCKFI